MLKQETKYKMAEEMLEIKKIFEENEDEKDFWAKFEPKVQSVKPYFEKFSKFTLVVEDKSQININNLFGLFNQMDDMTDEMAVRFIDFLYIDELLKITKKGE